MYVEIDSEQARVLDLAERQNALRSMGYEAVRDAGGVIVGLNDPYNDLKRRFLLFGFTATSPEETAAMSEYTL